MTNTDTGTVTGDFRELTTTQCEELLGAATLGRLAYCRSDGAHILPVNYRYHDSALIIQTSPDGPLAELAAGCDGVAFEVDHHSQLIESGWSVVVRGHIEGVSDPERELAPEALPRPLAPGVRTLVLRLTPAALSGRGVQRR